MHLNTCHRLVTLITSNHLERNIIHLVHYFRTETFKVTSEYTDFCIFPGRFLDVFEHSDKSLISMKSYMLPQLVALY